MNGNPAADAVGLAGLVYDYVSWVVCPATSRVNKTRVLESSVPTSF